ncbi:MAG: agmatine deiminase family protein, partial [Bacteroidales bacterium]|nr:agmatine deiminase family protein [Bacteroidales bacterium]
MKPTDEKFYFPAEWAKHDSTWLSYPHNENSWPGKIEAIFPYYNEFIRVLSLDETVNINVKDQGMKDRVTLQLKAAGTDMDKIKFHMFLTD